MTSKQSYYVEIDAAQTYTQPKPRRQTGGIKQNLALLTAFLEGNNAQFIGWKTDEQGNEYFGDAIISMTPETAGKIKKENFVAQVPVSNGGAMVFLAKDVTIHADRPLKFGMTG